MTKIKFETGQVVNFNGTPTQQDIEEVAASLGFNKPQQDKNDKRMSVADYATKSGEDVLFPAGPAGRERGALGGVAVDTLKVVPNIISDTWGGVKSLGTGIENATKVPLEILGSMGDIGHEAIGLYKDAGLWNGLKSIAQSIPEGVFESIIKPFYTTMIPESVKQGSGAGNDSFMQIASDWKGLIKDSGGSYSRAFGALMQSSLENVPDIVKTELENIDRMRIAFYNHPVTESLGLLGFKEAANGILNPKTAGKDLYKQASDTINKVGTEIKNDPIGSLKDTGNRLLTPFSLAKDLYVRNSKSTLLKTAENNAIQSKQVIDSLTDVNDKIASLPKGSEELNYLIHKKDALLSKVDLFSQKVKTDLSVQKNLLTENINENSFKTSDEAANTVKSLVEDVTGSKNIMYDQAFTDKQGNPIKVNITQSVIDSTKQLMDKAGSAMERGMYEKLKSYMSDFIVRKVLADKGGDIGSITVDDILPYEKYLPSKFFENIKLEDGSFQKEVNIDAFADPYFHQPVTADNLQSIRNNVHDTLGNHGGLLKDFDTTVKSSINSLLEDTLKNVDPQKYELLQKANNVYTKIKQSKVSQSIAKDASSATINKRVYSDWENFSKDYPSTVVDQYRNLKAKEILEKSSSGDVLNHTKMEKMLEENKTILGNQLYFELKNLNNGYKALDSFDTSLNDVNKSIESAKENAKVLGDNPLSGIKKIKNINDVDTYVKTAKLEKTTDVGDIAMRRILDLSKDNEGKIQMSDLKKALDEYKRIGSEEADNVYNKITSEDLKNAINDAEKTISEYNKVAKSGNLETIKRVLKGTASLLLFATGHPIIGTGYAIDALKPKNTLPEEPKL